ncbi:MAG TPA: TldD/PmbA family protein, partial [Ignisphaera sp.]|nr:TldD/PmbA family protein [Ignisphaera sp.]
ERAIGNTHSESVRDEHTYFGVFVNVKAVSNGEESGFYDFFYAPTTRGFDIDTFVSRATSIAVKSLYAKAIETGRYEVLLMPKVFGSILQAVLVPAICADWIQKKRSPLIGKLGEQVLSESISIVDDGAAPNLVGSRAFDDEGIQMQRKVVFDKGVLENYLYDNYTALIENRESTGNAYRRSATSSPIPWITNLIVIPGNQSIDDMINQIKRGIVVYATIGEWLSNPVNGLINATITNGFYVENGEIRYGVKGVVLSGNLYELLREKLVSLSKEVEGALRVYAPAILLRDVVVAGK